MLERSLEAFEKAGCFDKVLIVCRKDDEADITAAASSILSMPFETVAGGKERQHSVANALASIEGGRRSGSSTTVARCFVKPADYCRLPLMQL